MKNTENDVMKHRVQETFLVYKQLIKWTFDYSEKMSDECCGDCKKDRRKRFGRGAVSSGLTHECGVFGAIGTGEWPTQLDIPQIVCLGLVALQHR